MSIENFVDQMTAYIAGSPAYPAPNPCSEDEIDQLAQLFERKFKFPLPEAYKRVLRRANGVLHNGLTIWPAKPEKAFRETLVEANDDLREHFSMDYLYFGQRDEELYVYDLRRKEYCAIEFVGKPVWKQFLNAESMVEFMLERAWE